MDPISFSDLSENSSFLSESLRDRIGCAAHRLESYEHEQKHGRSESESSTRRALFHKPPRPGSRFVSRGRTSAIKPPRMGVNARRSPSVSPNPPNSRPNGQSSTSPKQPILGILRYRINATDSDTATTTTSKFEQDEIKGSSTPTPSYSSAQPIDLTSGPLDLRINIQTVDLPSAHAQIIYFTSAQGKTVDLSSPQGQEVDLPSAHSQAVDLPSAQGQTYDLPSAHAQTVDLPATYSQTVDLGQIVDLPSAHGQAVDLSSPQGQTVDPPSPQGQIVDLPSSQGQTVDIPSSQGQTIDLSSAQGQTVDLSSAHAQAVGDLNRTYDVIRVNRKKEPEDKFVDIDDDTYNGFDGSTLPMPLEAEPDMALINEGDPASHFLLPNEAYKSPLKLTFRRTSTGISIIRNQDSNLPSISQPLDKWPLLLEQSPEVSKVSMDSIQMRRTVVGSYGSYIEESTIFNEESQVQLTGSDSTIAPNPPTPDIRIAAYHTPTTNAFPVSDVDESSTPVRGCRLPTSPKNLTLTHKRSRSIHIQGHGNHERVSRYQASNQASIRAKESPRTRLLKQRAVERQADESVLNTGFQDQLPLDSGESKSPQKRQKKEAKKSSILSVFSRLSKCMTTANNTTLFQSNDTALSVMDNSNVALCPWTSCQTCPTTVFQTFTDSSSASMTSWCRHIRDVTRIPGPSEPPSDKNDHTDHTGGLSLKKSLSNAGTNTNTATGLDERKPVIDINSYLITTARASDTATTTGARSSYDAASAAAKSSSVESKESKEPKESVESKDNHKRKPGQPQTQSMPDILYHHHSQTDSSNSSHSPPRHLEGPPRKDGGTALTFKRSHVPSKSASRSRHVTTSRSAPHILHSSHSSSKPMRGTERDSVEVAEVPEGNNQQFIRKSSHLMPSSTSKEVKESKEFENHHDDPSDVRNNSVQEVGRQTAEWLASFVGDKDAESQCIRCDVTSRKDVLLQLCKMCNIKVKRPYEDVAMLRLKKSRKSRAPTEADVRRLERGTRRKGLSKRGSLV